jgi:hypothetical protein
MPDGRVAVLCAACGQQAVVQWQRRDADDPTATVAVYACAPHAITLADAARVHAAKCPAPDISLLPVCGCTPEVLPAPDPAPDRPTETLPTGWTIPVRQSLDGADVAADVSPMPRGVS